MDSTSLRSGKSVPTPSLCGLTADPESVARKSAFSRPALRRSLSPVQATVARSGSERAWSKSISVKAKVSWYKINLIGLLLYRKEVRTNSDYRICTSSILYGLVRNPALPPESPQQIGFGVVGVSLNSAF